MLNRIKMKTQTIIITALVILLVIAGTYIIYDKVIPNLLDKYRSEGSKDSLDNLGIELAKCNLINLNYDDQNNQLKNITLVAVECLRQEG